MSRVCWNISPYHNTNQRRHLSHYPARRSSIGPSSHALARRRAAAHRNVALPGPPLAQNPAAIFVTLTNYIPLSFRHPEAWFTVYD